MYPAAYACSAHYIWCSFSLCERAARRNWRAFIRILCALARHTNIVELIDAIERETGIERRREREKEREKQTKKEKVKMLFGSMLSCICYIEIFVRLHSSLLSLLLRVAIDGLLLQLYCRL